MPLSRAALDFHVQLGPTDKVAALGPLTQPNSHDIGADGNTRI
jgi:hypothetical protein